MLHAAHFRKCNTMAWESRAEAGRYYTRSRRVNGVVIREYIGSGAAGELVHELDVEERRQREQRRMQFKEAQRQDAELDARLDALIEPADGVARGLLILAGCHQHNRGEWRRRNGKE